MPQNKSVIPENAYARLVGAIEEYCDMTGDPLCAPFEYAGYSARSRYGIVPKIRAMEYFPLLKRFAMICEYIGVSPDYILGYSENMEYDAPEGAARSAAANFNELYAELCRRYTARQLADAFGCHPVTTASNMRYGGNDRMVKTAIIVANAIGLTFEQVVGMKGPR